MALLCGFILGSFLLTSCYAASDTNVSGQKGVNLVVNGKAIQPDVPAQIINDRTMVPVRFVAENLGLTVDYDSSTRTVIIRQGDMVVKLIIEGNAYKNEKEIPLDVQAMIIDNRTLVPVRFISEAFSANVIWDDANRTVTITKEAGDSIAVISPKSGDKWLVDENYTINWTYTGDPGNVKISLYKNEAFKTMIAPSISQGSGGSGNYDWKVPASLPSGSDYRIRITSLSDSNCFDLSDNNFFISSPNDQLVGINSPNGGENWQVGTIRAINWVYAGDPGNVKISLYKNGVFKTMIAPIISQGSGGSGSYDWKVPASLPPGSDYRIRITSLSDSNCFDLSDNNFFISPTSGRLVTVNSPNGGENWQVGTTHTINWVYAGDPGNVKISLYKNGVFKTMIAASLPHGSGSYNWKVPYSLTPGADYKIRITSLSDNNCFDLTDNNFTISSEP
jgi:hypothetical protein